MVWVIVCSVAGGAVLFVAFLAVLGYLIARRECPAEELGSARALDVSTHLPVPREARVTSPEQIRELVSFLTDERQPSVRGASPTLGLRFHMESGRVHQIEASPLGWNWHGDWPLNRKINDAFRFVRVAEALLPGITEADLDAISVPQEDLSRFDESRVPEDLRDLVPLARKWGVGDDLIRGEMVRRATSEERHDLTAQVLPRASRILEHIESHGLPSLENPLSDECTRFMFMWEAAQEAQAYQDPSEHGCAG